METENWDDFRIALAVARAGTVSGGAQALSVHHATVIRRIDALEARLGTRLFQRHPRGYALTESGRTLLEAAGSAEERFAQMAARISGAGERIEGELVLTSLPELSDLVMSRLIGLMRQHPGLLLRYVTDPRLFRLDAGEAHVAIRAGTRPTEPDYVVRRMTSLLTPLYAAPAYLQRHGPVDDLAAHQFILPSPAAHKAPYMRWLEGRISRAGIVMESNDPEARLAAIRAGLGLGWLLPKHAEGLVEVMSLPEWESVLWLVSHVDLHRTPKVQAVLAALRGEG